jgi:hypothetical protein
MTSPGNRLGLGRLGPDLAALQGLLELTLSERSQGIESLPGQRQLGDLVLWQLPIGEMDRYQPSSLVVAKRHSGFYPLLEPGRIQGARLGQQLADPETHAIDRRIHLVLDLLEP